MPIDYDLEILLFQFFLSLFIIVHQLIIYKLFLEALASLT